jgi:hypothetical protein
MTPLIPSAVRKLAFSAALAVLSSSLSAGNAHAGTWAGATSPFPNGADGPRTVALLTDGRVLCDGGELSTSWYTLTPNPSGSYLAGTWAQVGSSNLGRFANPDFILKDGRFWICGGEYQTDNIELLQHAKGTHSAVCEIFDPVTNQWTRGPDAPEIVGDSQAAVMAGGGIINLVNDHFNNHTQALLPPYAANQLWIQLATYDTVKLRNEGLSLLLPDGSVLFGNFGFQRYLENSNTFVDAIPAGATFPKTGPAFAEFGTGHGDGEIGPALLLYPLAGQTTSRVLVLGGNQENGLYTPPPMDQFGRPGIGPGSWIRAADTAASMSHGDAPASVEPNGLVLAAVGNADPGGSGTATFYEYTPDSGAGTWVSAQPAMDSRDHFCAANRVRMLNLPSGDILVTCTLSDGGTGFGRVWLYTPSSGPRNSWRPTITSISAPTAGEFTVSGTQLNGLTTGSDFGDDAKMATNYPIVSLSAGGRVYFARSYNFDQMAPRLSTNPGGAAGSCAFRLPTTIPNGTYQVSVTANGVSSTTQMPLTVSGNHVAAITGTSSIQNPGSGLTWFVNLSAPAAGATVVNLSTSNSSIASVPSSVTVPSQATSAAFTVTGRGFGLATISANLSTPNAQFGPATKTFGWTVNSLSGSFSAPSDGATRMIAPGNETVIWTVTLSDVAPSRGVSVTMASSNLLGAAVPAAVFVPANQKSVDFLVSRNSYFGNDSAITASLSNSSKTLWIDTAEAARLQSMSWPSFF